VCFFGVFCFFFYFIGNGEASALRVAAAPSLSLKRSVRTAGTYFFCTFSTLPASAASMVLLSLLPVVFVRIRAPLARVDTARIFSSRLSVPRGPSYLPSVHVLLSFTVRRSVSRPEVPLGGRGLCFPDCMFLLSSSLQWHCERSYSNFSLRPDKFDHVLITFFNGPSRKVPPFLFCFGLLLQFPPLS